MNATKIFLYLFTFLWLCVGTAATYNYIQFRKTIATTEPVQYSVQERKTHIGRGRSYDLLVNFNNRIYYVASNSAIHYGIDDGIYPKLYYVPARDKVISSWSVEFNKRIALIGFGFSIVLPLLFRQQMGLTRRGKLNARAGYRNKKAGQIRSDRH
ncbi:hypothetical protein MKQ68_10250 [Chitinophaga horti]|uniref:DUF3592 domain-containing protein n=1 Tax=Chitinophaga horti TaxID=2920382 RepID=A0ABY6J723_9BACT|nr:hypothetical protein [Chitinophaga horti]UYQ95480.1 hypothetical protein MKQ68_10250 [Chitinophaga horti]